MNPPPTLDESMLAKLNTQATTRLEEIVEGFGRGKNGYTGYDAGEVEAARTLIKGSDIVVG